MGVYKIAWLGVASALFVTGVAVAVLSVPPGALVPLVLCAAIIGPLIGAGVYAQLHAPKLAQFPFLLAATVLATLGITAVTGLIALVGAVALLGIALLTATAPPVLRRLLHHKPRQAPTVVTSPAPEPPALSPIPTCTSLTEAELCWRWRTSFAALQHAASPGERLRLIETRSALLDELAARNPDGFTRWMTSGARAASDPARFLTPHRSDPPQRQEGP